ncbi:hypothetical protein Gogos_020110 [Gossypium gossypioides]|uniref:Uncharacterized protein n=1 Tax=Gossypium gossypioides TaxID=34282 RepID=A0A7J9D557_GOSGO|nr:hypothetical protein [Gossypium gossypioides]
MTLQRKDGWRSFKISKMKMSNGVPFGWSSMRFCTDVKTLIRSLCLEFRELSDMFLCSY